MDSTWRPWVGKYVFGEELESTCNQSIHRQIRLNLNQKAPAWGTTGVEWRYKQRAGRETHNHTVPLAKKTVQIQKAQFSKPCRKWAYHGVPLCWWLDCIPCSSAFDGTHTLIPSPSFLLGNGDGPSDEVPASHVGDQDGVHSSLLWHPGLKAHVRNVSEDEISCSISLSFSPCLYLKKE